MASKPAQPGTAWTWDKKTKAWVKPTKPTTADMSYEWDDNKGWVGTSMEEKATDWGLALTVINSNDELKTLFNEAWSALARGQEWSAATFAGRLQNTDWYKTRSVAQREFYVLKNDPRQRGEYDARVAANVSSLKNVANIMGATLSEEQYKTLAEENLLNGWNEAQIKSAISTYISYNNDPASGLPSLIGEAGNAEDKIRSFAGKMGIDIADDWVLNQVRIASQMNGSTQGAEDFIRNRAKEKYSLWSDDLNNPDTTIEDLAYNYRSTMANMFEVGLNEITLNDPLLKQVMESGNGQGGKKSNFEFEKDLRMDARWSTTKNAKEETNGIVNDVLSTFGLI